MPEPVKYGQVITSTGKKVWQLTPEWKEWDRERKLIAQNKNKPKTRTKRKQLDRETHVFNWKEVASFSGSTRKVYFCCCLSEQGNPYRGCGAVGVASSRSGEITITGQPRFEDGK